MRFPSLIISSLLLTWTKAQNVTDDLPIEWALIQAIADDIQWQCAAVQGDSGCAELATGRRLDLFDEGTVGAHLFDNPPNVKRLLATRPELQHRDLSPELACLGETLACHLYLDNLYMPPLEEYDFQQVCIKKDDPRCDGLKDIKFTKDTNLDPGEFRYQAGGPPQLQGVFSLEYDPCSASSLTTWAKTREDVGGIATGTIGDVIGEDGFLIPPNALGPVRNLQDYSYAIRVLGDGNWAFAQGLGVATALSATLNLVYKFYLTRGDDNNPKQFLVVPDIKLPFTCLRVQFLGCLMDLLKFELTLVEDCSQISSANSDRDTDARNACNSGSFVWRRDTYVMNTLSDTYYVIQVVDGKGDKLPAYNEIFVPNQDDCGYATNAFTTLNEASGGTAGFCHCTYTGELPYGLDNLLPWEGLFDNKGSKKRGRKLATDDEEGHMGNVRSNKGSTTKKTRRGHDMEMGRRRKLESCPDLTMAPTDSPQPTSEPAPAPEGKGSKRRGLKYSDENNGDDEETKMLYN